MTTILLIDDEHAIVELLSLLLEDEGYEVLTAFNGEEGFTWITRRRPALVLCDLMMPVLGGRDLYRRMQDDPGYRTIPFVMMSAVTAAITQVDPPYAAVIDKPFDVDAVLAIVEQLAPPSSVP